LVELAFKKAQSMLAKFTASEQYHDYLLGLIELSAKKISQQNLVVKVKAKDKGWLTDNLLNDISKKIGIDLKLSIEFEDFIGGCKVQTADDKIIYDSTIDSHLQELKSVFRVEVARLLFGESV
jgi:vacuolar-type H+-ATPase subunit E/Vma4